MIVDQLVQKKSLTKQEFFHLVEEYGHVEQMPKNIIDIRKSKLLQFQQMMMAGKERAQGSLV